MFRFNYKGGGREGSDTNIPVNKQNEDKGGPQDPPVKTFLFQVLTVK